MADLYLGLDIGGTKLAVGIANAEGRVLADAAEPTDPTSRPGDVVEALYRMSQAVCAKAGVGLRDLRAVGISYGGPVDYPAGVTVTCHHLQGWEKVPLVRMVEERFGLPAAMDNDANAAALAEAVFGAGRGHTHLLYLTVSSGIGGGIIIEGEIYRGATSMAGEIGHMTVKPDGPVCTCGRRGCLEAMASGWSIARRAQEAAAAWPGESALKRLAEITAQAVAQAAEAGDALALEIMRETADNLAFGIGAGVNLLNPTLVVIGGGVSQAGEVLFGPLREALGRYALKENAQAVRVAPAALGAQVGVLGGVALARSARAG
jgi:glucokinase